MFFRGRTRRSGSTQARYGRGPILTSRSTHRAGRLSKKNHISNIELPSLATVKKILIAMIAAGLLGMMAYFIWFSGYFNIEKIYVQYEEFQNENIDILNYFDNLRGKNYLFADPAEKIPEIQKAHPELSKIIVEKIFPNTIKISFTEFPITANIESIVNGKSREKVLINSIGMVIYRDTENPNLPYIKVITTEVAEPIIETPLTTEPVVKSQNETAPQATTAPTDSPLISQEHLTYMLSAVSSFEERFGMKVLELRLLPQAREFHMKTEKNFEIWLDIQIPYEKQFLKLKKAMSTLDIYKTPLFYIDLRISGSNGEKVIFKRKK